MGDSIFDRVEVKETDMDAVMVKASIDITREAQKLFKYDKDVAAHIKETIESRFGPTWHCVVGKSFGSRVSYEQQHFILLKVNRTSVMIFKCGY
ncbi:hypothetical protein QR680_003181 [Steinernema hermaphroditum]|uniref:Dynein light chain n=1 Tax=Steinernema hermaphroditum TaxID=289476 RepID=A0AA39H5P8_9BILA|nr:hypothetical protein QR680_003181 [Steinernema hermaphroditum]